MTTSLSTLSRLALPLLLLAAVSSCNVQSADEGSSCAPISGARGERGLVLINNSEGYASTSVQIIDWSGKTASRALLSSGSASVGLSAALSGDVIAPFNAPAMRNEVVLLDRQASVVTWISLRDCAVRGQMSVGDGFVANPYDYAEVAPNKAYVARYNQNPTQAAGGLNAGSDILVIDPASQIALRTISLTAYAGGGRPTPSRLVPWSHNGKSYVLALLQGFTGGGYDDASSGVVVGIDPANDEIRFSTTIAGIKNCGHAVALADGRVIVGCTGIIGTDGSSLQPGTSAIVELGPSSDGEGLIELSRVPASTLGGQPLAPYFDVILADDGRTLVFIGAYGNLDKGQTDRWFLVDLKDQSLAQTVTVSSKPFVLGSIACRQRVVDDEADADTDAGAASSIETVCMGTDAEQGSGRIRRFHLEGTHLVEDGAMSNTDPYGMSPRLFGKL